MPHMPTVTLSMPKQVRLARVRVGSLKHLHPVKEEAPATIRQKPESRAVSACLARSRVIDKRDARRRATS